MPLDGGNFKSIYDDIRSLLSLDLTPNELRAMLTYLVEKDEASREVRNKSQEDLRAISGMSRSRFSAATSGLIERGLIETHRHRQSAQTIAVMSLNRDIPESETSHNRDIPETGIEMSRNPGLRCPANADIPKDIGSSTALNGSSAREPSESEVNRLHRLALEVGRSVKGDRVAKSARAVQRGRGELDGSRDIAMQDGALAVTGEARRLIAEAFPGVDVDAVADRACPDLRKQFQHPTYDDAMAVMRKWARILKSDRQAQPVADVLPFKVSPTTVRYAKPVLDEPEVAHA